MFKEDLPLAVRDELDRRGLNGVPVLLSTSTDLSLAGRPGRHWIVATRENVAAVVDGVAPEVETHVPVGEVAEFRTQGAIGSGFLQAYIDEHWVDLARFSNADADRFARCAVLGSVAHDRRSDDRPDRAVEGHALPDVWPAVAGGE